MPNRYISNRAAIEGLNLVRRGGVTRMERMRAHIELSAHAEEARLKGKIAVFPGLRKASYCAVLYAARSPFEFEIGRSPAPHLPAVSRSDRRWVRSPAAPSCRFTGPFPASPIRKNGGFEIKFPANFLSENLFESIVVVGRTDYIMPPAKKDRTLAPRAPGEGDREFFGRYLEFLRHNRAYLSDFMLSCLARNTNVLLTTPIADKCTINFK